MKLPKDALIEWRCSCGGLCGYVRRWNGRLTYVARHRDQRREVGHDDPVWGDGDEFRDMPVDASTRQIAQDGLIVSCGSHFGKVFRADFVPDKLKRRKVIVKRITRTEMTQGSTDTH